MKPLHTRRTKIIATVGPATSSPEAMEELLLAGVDVIRLNLSHGDHAAHAKVIEVVRETSERLGLSTGILADLCGPKIRTGRVKDGGVLLSPGDNLTMTTEDTGGGDGVVSTTYNELPQGVSSGGKILIDDGLIELTVISNDSNNVYCEVIYGGILKDSKGIN
ncbi:MAG: pyruvate kinase, partial [bacterium]|nr:pyruvate kinase [bacterium]